MNKAAGGDVTTNLRMGAAHWARHLDTCRRA